MPPTDTNVQAPQSEPSPAEAAEGTPTQEANESASDAFVAPASQEELDQIVESRLNRERRKYADYEEVKKRAEEYEKFLDSQKTEDQKRAEEYAQLKAENAQLKQQQLRATVAAKYEIPMELMEMLNGESEETLNAQAQMLADKLKKTTAGPVVNGLASGSATPQPSQDWLRSAFTS